MNQRLSHPIIAIQWSFFAFLAVGTVRAGSVSEYPRPGLGAPTAKASVRAAAKKVEPDLRDSLRSDPSLRRVPPLRMTRPRPGAKESAQSQGKRDPDLALSEEQQTTLVRVLWRRVERSSPDGDRFYDALGRLEKLTTDSAYLKVRRLAVSKYVGFYPGSGEEEIGIPSLRGDAVKQTLLLWSLGNIAHATSDRVIFLVALRSLMGALSLHRETGEGAVTPADAVEDLLPELYGKFLRRSREGSTSSGEEAASRMDRITQLLEKARIQGRNGVRETSHRMLERIAYLENQTL